MLAIGKSIYPFYVFDSLKRKEIASLTQGSGGGAIIDNCCSCISSLWYIKRSTTNDVADCAFCDV